tara:strand:+ start:248 stop:676 length:429 start_codon:yes stop_codon:yes gene_type:complete
MRHLPVFLLSSPKTITRVVNGTEVTTTVQAYRYSTRKGLSGSVKIGDKTVKHSVSYWAGPGSSTAIKGDKDSLTMWLNDSEGFPLPAEQINDYKAIFGTECYFEVDDENNIVLMTTEAFNQLPAEDRNIVPSSVFAPSPIAS